MSAPVRIPADVDMHDRVLGPLTARQLAILAAAGTVLYLIWAATRAFLPIPVFLAFAAPVGAASAVLALGMRDGVPMDKLLVAAIRQRLAPRHRVAAPEGVRPAPAWFTASREVLQTWEHVIPRVSAAYSAFDAVNVVVGHPGIWFNVGFHRQQGADACAGLVSCASPRLQQRLDLAVLLVEHERQVARRIDGHGQHSRRQMYCQSLGEHPLKYIVEKRHARPCMQVEELFRDYVEPVLLVITHRVDGPEGARFGFLKFDDVVPGGQSNAFLEADRPAGLSIEDVLLSGLHECSL